MRVRMWTEGDEQADGEPVWSLWSWMVSPYWLNQREKKSDVGRWGQACFGGERRVKNTDMGVAEL